MSMRASLLSYCIIFWLALPFRLYIVHARTYYLNEILVKAKTKVNFSCHFRISKAFPMCLDAEHRIQKCHLNNRRHVCVWAFSVIEDYGRFCSKANLLCTKFHLKFTKWLFQFKARMKTQIIIYKCKRTYTTYVTWMMAIYGNRV